LLAVYKANGEHLLESGGRPVCGTVLHQSLDDLILTLSECFWIFFIEWDRYVPEEFVCLGLALLCLGMMRWGTSLFFFLKQTLVLDFLLFFLSPFFFLFFSFCNAFFYYQTSFDPKKQKHSVVNCQGWFDDCQVCIVFHFNTFLSLPFLQWQKKSIKNPGIFSSATTPLL